MTEKKNIAFGVILAYISLAVSLLGSLFVTPIILNNVGDANYGLLSFCNSLTSWLSLISSSLGASYIYFATKDKSVNGDETKTNSIFSKLFIFVSIIVFIFAATVLILFYLTGFRFSNYTEEQNNLILLLLFISSIQVILTIIFYIFSLNNQYTKSFVFSKGLAVILSIFSYLANVLIAIFTKSIILIATVGIISALISGIINLFYAIKIKKMNFKKITFSNYKDDLFRIGKYSLIILVSTVIANLDSNLDKTLLGIMVNSESVAMYQLSINFSSHLIVAAYAFTEVVRPKLYALYREGKKDEANSLFLKTTKIQSIIVVLIIFGYFSCGYHFNILWVGSERIDVFYYSSVLFFCQIVPVTKSISTEAYRANNLHKIPLIISIISIIINLFISISLIIILEQRWAIWACVIGTFIPRVIFTWIINPIVEIKYIQTPIKKYYLNLAKLVMLAIVALIPSIFMSIYLENVNINVFFKVLIEGILFVSAYAFMMFIFERKFVIEYLSKFRKNRNVTK